MKQLADIKSICLLRLSALGDVCMIVPVVRTLQKALPGVHISWIISRPAYELVEGLDGVEFIVIDKPRGLLDYLKLFWRLRKQKYDVVLAMQAALRANILYMFLRAPVKIGFDKQRARDGQQLFTNQKIPFVREHLTDSFFSFAAAIGIKQRLLEWRLPIAEVDKNWATAHIPLGMGPLLIVNPAASKPERNWTVAKYADVLNRIYHRGAKIIFTGGDSQAEHELIDAIKSRITDDVADLSGQTSPKQLLALLAQADCLLAPDTGPVHMAVAVDTPVVGLYAVSPSWLSGPYINRGYIIDHFDDAVRTILKKDPAQVPWGTRVHTQKAMDLITVPEVMSRLVSALEGKGLKSAAFESRDISSASHDE